MARVVNVYRKKKRRRSRHKTKQLAPKKSQNKRKNRKKKKPQENLDKKDPETGLTEREKREMIKILQRQNEKLIIELREQQRLTGGVVPFRLYERGPRRVL